MKLKRKIEHESLVTHIALSGICKPVSMVIGYIYVPIVLNYLGVEKYGIWSTILTILSWISYFDIGIGNGLRNRLTESIAANDYMKSRCLVSSAYVFVSIIIMIVSAISCLIALFVDWNKIFGVIFFAENLSVIVCLSVIFVSINFILSLCKNILYALQKAANVSFMELSIQILNLCGVFLATKIVPGNLFLMAMIYGSSMTITNVIFSLLLYKRNVDLIPSIKYVDLAIGKNLTNLGIQFFIIQIAALVLFTTDSLIISYFYGPICVTSYSTVNKLFHAISSIYLAFLAPIWSAVTKAKSEKNSLFFKKILKRIRLFMLPFFSGIILLINLFRPIAGWWLGQELNYEPGLILLGGIYCALTIWCNAYANIINGLEMMKISMATAIIQATVNIPLSVLFAVAFNLRTTGVLLGTVLSMLIAALVFPVAVAYYLRHEMCGGKKYE